MKSNAKFFEQRIGNSFHYQNKWMDRYAWEIRTRIFSKIITDDWLVNKSVADYGCGDGSWGKYMEDAGAMVLGVEQSPKLVKSAGINACLSSDFNRFYNLFNLITFFTVFNFILPSKRKQTIEDCKNALKRGGKLVILDYLPDRVAKYQKNLEHKLVWTSKKTESFITEMGFKLFKNIPVNWVDTTLFHYFGGNWLTYKITKFLDTHFMFKPKYRMLVFKKI